MTRRRKPWAIVGVAVLLLIVTAAVAGILYAAPIVAAAVNAGLTRAGIAHDDVEVQALSWRGVTLAPVRLGENRDLTAESMTVSWSLSGLRERHVDRVRIEGARAKVSLADGNLSIAGLPPAGGGNGAIALPFSRLDVVDAEISVDAPSATARITGDVTVRASKEISFRGNVKVAAQLEAKSGAPQSVDLDIRNLGGTLAGHKLSLLTSEIAAATPMGPAKMSVRAVADLDDIGAAEGVLTVSPPSGGAAAWPRLKISVKSRRAGDLILFAGDAEVAKNAAHVRIDGRHDLASGNGNLYLEAAPIQFRPGGLQPSDLSAAVPAFFKKVTGKIQGETAIVYRQNGKPKISGSATFDGFGFDTGIARLSELHGTIDLSSLQPLTTALPQKIQGTVRVDPIPPMPFNLTFGMPGDGSLNVEAFRLDALGGNVSLSDLSVEPSRPVETQIRIDRADVGRVLALVDVEGLSGSGTMSGTIPVRVDRTQVDIDDGSLVSDGPGVLRYTGRGLDQAARAAGGDSKKTVDLLRRALADFHYDKLTLGIDRDRTGHGVLSVRLAGSNPAVLDGYPFNININLETNFDNLAAVLLDGYAAANRLMRKGIGR